MRRVFISLSAASMFLMAIAGGALAQTPPSAPTVSPPSSMADSPALKDTHDSPLLEGPQDLQVHPKPLPLPEPRAGHVAPPSANAVLQSRTSGAPAPETKTGFPGIGANGYIPPDPNIAVGPAYIVQVVNSEIAVFDKSGNLLSGPKTLGSLWAGLGGGCARNNAGDPIVQYDRAADRWVVTQLGSIRKPYSECIAVSTSNDPRGTYHLYSYSFGTNLNDYPKFGIWPTASNPAYLATYNMFANGQTFSGAQLCAYDRTAMLKGLPANSICYSIPNDGGFLPSDLEGVTPPSPGSAGYFLNFESLGSLRLYKLLPNFATPSNSKLTLATPDITVASFNEACGGGVCIPQPLTSRQLDSLGDRLMYRLVYRNFGTYESMVTNHSVAAGSSVGVDWYELRSSAPGQFSLYQQGIFAPADNTYRWMGSIAMNKNGAMALGYSTSSSNSYPAIAVTSRCASTALGYMGSESVLQPGAGSQTGFTRWGDYTSMRVDPSDDTTFWYTNEFYTQTASYQWSTMIGSFVVPSSCP